ncbi:unnamed protein product [marine sediment metagenome]|uniref:DNA gyrase inhibitor YacG n=1 Tax=marine sediment metagenome TaxID=412755 RepID=X0T0V9_9ZZZZ
MDEVDTECVVCGGHIIAGSYPPVCSKDCRLEWDIEIEFNRWIKDEKTKHTTIKND